MTRKKMPIRQLLAAAATGGFLLVPVAVAAVYFQTAGAPKACTITTKYGSGFYPPGTVQYTVICPPGTKPVISTVKGLDDGDRFPNNRPDVCLYC